MKIENIEITNIEINPFLENENPNINEKVNALIEHQMTPVTGFAKLSQNMKLYRESHFSYIKIDGITFRVFYNPTRKQNVTANTFSNSSDDFKCFLCDLLPGQRGIKFLNGKYMIIVNPGITIPGDLTIPTINHELQILKDHFEDMLILAKELSDYSIFFNGPLAGATCPHFHFQAGVRNRLPAEISINQIIDNSHPSKLVKNIIFHDNETEIFRIENFLRPTYCCYASSEKTSIKFFKQISEILKKLSTKYIIDQPNIPDFGSYINVFEKDENEARFNVMTKYYPHSDKYLVVVFPKRYNRPQAYFSLDDSKVTLGFAIKEALGNILTATRKDFYKVLNDTSILRQTYNDTSIVPEMDEELLSLLKTNLT